ncbi:MAG: replicative DNA helicase [Bacillota bacterium]
MAASERLPPQSLEAEQCVLGSMLIERQAILRAMEVVGPEDFYREAHRRIFEVMVRLADRGEAVDLITVCEGLRQQEQLEAVGGMPYITSLANLVPTAANVEHYARIVQEKAILRGLINAATEVVTRGYGQREDVEVLLDEAEQLIFKISQRRAIRGFSPIKDVLMETLTHIEQLYSNKGSALGVPSGFADLDRLTSGFQRSDLVILAARPSMGKTALSLNIARHAAVGSRTTVAVFSLEMSKEQLAQRLLCSEAAIDSQRLRMGALEDNDWRRLSIALGRLGEAPVFIDDTPSISILELRTKARRIKAEHGLGLVVVDYLQLMQSRNRAENRQQEISEISRSLKALARELDVPVLACSQLSRAVEQRTDRRPLLSDLRESGAIEQDADVVMFLHQNPDAAEANVLEVIVAKQRNGPTGSVKLYFAREYQKFENLEHRG